MKIVASRELNEQTIVEFYNIKSEYQSINQEDIKWLNSEVVELNTSELTDINLHDTVLLVEGYGGDTSFDVVWYDESMQKAYLIML